jgi:hypothetical protein
MTKEKFAEKVLQKLRVWDRGTMDPVDFGNVIDAYAGVYAFLEDEGLAAWALESEEVPERFPSLITLVAAEIADVYASPEPTGIGWTQAKAVALQQIRRQLTTRQTADVVAPEFF